MILKNGRLAADLKPVQVVAPLERWSGGSELTELRGSREGAGAAPRP